MTRRVNDCKDYDQWLKSVQEAREKIACQRAAAGRDSGSPPLVSEGTEGTEDPQSPNPPDPPIPLPEGEQGSRGAEEQGSTRIPDPSSLISHHSSLIPCRVEEVDPEEAAEVQEQIAQSLAEAEVAEREAGRPVAVPAFTVEVETPDHPGTVASVYGGKKQIVRRYDRLPEVPPEEAMNVFDPERTLRVEEPVVATPEEGDLLAGSPEREETASPSEGLDRSNTAEADLPSAGGTKPAEELPAGAAAAEVAPSRGGSAGGGGQEDSVEKLPRAP